MLAYHGNPTIKTDILAQLARHREADELVKGQYWKNGKGCAVGCTLYSDDHAEYESRFGIPQMLARLEDRIFEGLPNDRAQVWPERFMSAILPGTGLARVGWRFQHWLLTDETINPGIKHPIVVAAIAQCAAIIEPLTKGGTIDKSAAWSAVSAASSAAWSAARSAESAATSAESAAWSAESAAWSAVSAAWSAVSAASAATSAESAARSAASAESAAWSAARSAAFVRMSDKLIALIEAA